MNDWLKKIRTYIRNKDFLISLFVAIVFFAISLVINFLAGTYASKVASNSVTDIILSNTRVYDVDFLFTYGLFVMWVPMGIFCFWHPKHIPFVLKSIALFMVIRAVFISITHIGPFPTHIDMDIVGNLNSLINFSGDLFFSAHTGLPFLMALIFWDYKKIRYFCIICSIFFGTVVLLGHVHYSIDVLGAFFITYTIFHIAEIIFKKDRQVFYSGI
jgi:hypothetical protein